MAPVEQRRARPTAPVEQRWHSQNQLKTVETLPRPTRRFQNSSRKHQRCSRSLQNNFLFHFTTKSSTDPKGTHDRARARAGGLIELQNPSDRIMHAGTIEISRLSHPPTSDSLLRFTNPVFFRISTLVDGPCCDPCNCKHLAPYRRLGGETAGKSQWFLRA